ncbi:MAG: hypothetical protein Q8R13_04330 [bacterium]|nr:hypothetical protein [bacterium]MDZ4296627.1 hypothetical protein [Patescibacteria group bacterium]
MSLDFRKNPLEAVSIVVAIVALLGGAAFWLGYRNGAMPDGTAAPSPTPSAATDADWKTYRDPTYNFELRHPPLWNVTVTTTVEPVINIYRRGNPPLTHHTNETQVSIFPNGLGTEGPAGRSREVEERDITREDEAHAVEFFLENNGRPWGHFISFTNPPASWGDFGFVWASAKIQNPQLRCRDPQKTLEQCDPFGDGLDVSGTVDPEEYATIGSILATFAFTESPSTSDTSTWKIYRNEEYGFEVRYPQTSPPKYRGLQRPATSRDDFIALADAQGVFFSISAAVTAEDLDAYVHDLTQNNDSGTGKTRVGATTVDRKQAVSVRTCGDPGCYHDLYIVHAGYLFRIGYSVDGNTDLFDQTLLTFKFTK